MAQRVSAFDHCACGRLYAYAFLTLMQSCITMNLNVYIFFQLNRRKSNNNDVQYIVEKATKVRRLYMKRRSRERERKNDDVEKLKKAKIAKSIG